MRNKLRMLIMCVCVAAMTAQIVAADETPAQIITCEGGVVVFTGVKPEYTKALLAVAAEARRVYAEKFGFDMPDKITLNIEKKQNGKARLWTDGQSQMFLEISSSASLAPPMQGGVFNIYGMCHELGHMVMYRKAKLIGLPEGIGEGWAHYAGSVVVDHVYKKLGQDVWPQPYNYSEVEGVARLAKSAQNPDDSKSAITRAALVFYNSQQRYGEDKVMAAMKIALDKNPLGKDVMPLFADALAKLTNDESARALVPEEFLTPKVNWKVSERAINEETTKGQVKVDDNTGFVLKYDDGVSDKKLSTSGSGHAIMFYAPVGSWAVDSIQLYGSRYGTKPSPEENFSIFICDQDFNVIKTIEKPYSTFETGDPKWYKMSFEPVNVPQGFYVCVYFAPTAAKGVYVYYDTDVDKSHSRSALPWTFVYDIKEKQDWMIRPHLIRTQ
jgi:hypothetical protein